jgi:hypothetical protein
MAPARPRVPRAVGGAVFFFLIGVGFVVYLAVRGADTKDPPSTRELIVLAVFSALAQVIASYMWSLVGRANPAHARSAVRLLLRAQGRALRFAANASSAYETGNANDRRLELGRLTSGLDDLAEDLEGAIKDWREVHPSALKNLGSDEDIDQ